VKIQSGCLKASVAIEASAISKRLLRRSSKKYSNSGWRRKYVACRRLAKCHYSPGWRRKRLKEAIGGVRRPRLAQWQWRCESATNAAKMRRKLSALSKAKAAERKPAAWLMVSCERRRRIGNPMK